MAWLRKTRGTSCETFRDERSPNGFSLLPWLLMGMGAFSNLFQGRPRSRGSAGSGC